MNLKTIEFQYAIPSKDELVWYRTLDKLDEQQIEGKGKKVIFSSTGEHHVSMHVTNVASGITRLHWEIEGTAYVEWVSCQYRGGQSEHFYGFGEKFDTLDHRGKEVCLWVENGCVEDLTYKPIPFYISSSGYAVHIDHRELIYARMATPDLGHKVQLKIRSNHLDLTIFEDTEITNIIEKYSSYIGKPTLPPPWFFGVWKSRDWRVENQETVLLDLQKQRALGVPCSVKLIDAAWEQELNDFNFHDVKFPDFQQVMDEVKKQDFQIVLWISPWIAHWADIYKELDDKGFFIKNPNGETYVHRLGNSPSLVGSMVDFTNPDAVDWWQQKCEQLMKLGVRGLKTDFGEQVPEDAVFYDGSTGKTMHNFYPVLYNQVTHDVVNKYNGILLGRSAWAGSQAFTGVWAGDQTADFSPRSGMLSTIFAGQNIGISGFPYWGSDIGGYFGTPDKECFIRWTQYASFTPCMELHGLGERDPWDMDEESYENYIRYASMHTRLFPYLYQSAIEASNTGVPMMRAMMIHFNDDPMIHELECVKTQYMLGKDWLVAPIFFEGRDREVYLPDGMWIDVWSGESRQGPWQGKVAASLDQLPLWLRDGAVVPLLSKDIQTIGQYEEPEKWMDTLGTEQWEFLLTPGNGSFAQGGIRIALEKKDESQLVHLTCSPSEGVSPLKVLFKYRVPLEYGNHYSVFIKNKDSYTPYESKRWSWKDEAWESGLWIEIPISSSDISNTTIKITANMEDGR